MKTESSTSTPSNIAEFNAIVGHVFAQLYESFPVANGLNDLLIARAMNVSSGVLPSGRQFDDVLRHSVE